MPRARLNRSLPITSFGSRSSAMEVTEGIDLEGRCIVVTGCTNGIGRETMRVLSARGATVIASGRSVERLESVTGITGRVTGGSTSGGGRGEIIPIAFDLADFASVARASDAILALDRPIDGVICNAGILAPAALERIAGVEKTFATNHLGHYILVRRLLPALQTGGRARIVMTSSDAAYQLTPLASDRPALEGVGPYTPMRAYSRSKLAGALFSRALARRLAGTGVTSNALHPGFVRSNIASTATPTLRLLMKFGERILAKNLERGAATTCHVIAAPQLEGVSSAFFQDCNPVTITGRHRLEDDALAEDLWDLCESFTQDFLA
jgi:NAD(P)-dependent dehydrogenase (short-subunit alcohol dehydrogenase family)